MQKDKKVVPDAIDQYCLQAKKMFDFHLCLHYEPDEVISRWAFIAQDAADTVWHLRFIVD